MVWHFCDFSTIYYEFCKILVFVEKEKDKEKGRGPLGPILAQLGPCAAPARRRQAAQRASGARARPQAVAHGAASVAQRGAGMSGPDVAGSGTARRPTVGSPAVAAPICAEAPVLLTISIHGSKTLFRTIYLSHEIHHGNP